MFYSEGFFLEVGKNITYSQKVRNLAYFNKRIRHAVGHCKKINFYNVWTEMAIVWMSVEQQMAATLKCLGYV